MSHTYDLEDARSVATCELRAGPWRRSLDPEHIARLVASKYWPAIHVTSDMVVIDGAHRLAAAHALGRSEVAVIVRADCQTATEARAAYLKANAPHGLPIDREHTITTLMDLIDGGWAYSDRETQARLGIRRDLVAEARRRLAARARDWSTGDSEWSTGPSEGQLTTRRTIGADGRFRPASREDREALRRAILETVDPAVNPKPNISALARQFGTTRVTVRKLVHQAQMAQATRPHWWVLMWRRVTTWLGL